MQLWLCHKSLVCWWLRAKNNYFSHFWTALLCRLLWKLEKYVLMHLCQLVGLFSPSKYSGAWFSCLFLVSIWRKKKSLSWPLRDIFLNLDIVFYIPPLHQGTDTWRHVNKAEVLPVLLIQELKSYISKYQLSTPARLHYSHWASYFGFHLSTIPKHTLPARSPESSL